MNSRLPPRARLFWLAVLVALGLVPSVLFFAWVERGCALPVVPIELGWPWIWLPQDSSLLLAAWNVFLILAFGAIHSLLAQPAAHARLARRIPAQAIRAAYLAATGLSLLAVMGFWQSTGKIIWAAPLSQKTTYVISIALYCAFFAVPLRLAQGLSFTEFLGLRQIYQTPAELTRTEGTPKLLETGLYGWVRHPIYLFTMLAFAVTPTMTLDRLLVLGASLAYLAWGIPLEERKLIRVFGPAYEAYRSRVPALFPRFSAAARSQSASNLSPSGQSD